MFFLPFTKDILLNVRCFVIFFGLPLLLRDSLNFRLNLLAGSALEGGVFSIE